MGRIGNFKMTAEVLVEGSSLRHRRARRYASYLARAANQIGSDDHGEDPEQAAIASSI